MALPTFTKASVTTVTLSRGDAFPRRTPADERQVVGVSENKTVRVATLSGLEEFLVLNFTGDTALPTADYNALLAFFANALINYRAFTFTYTDVDSIAYTVRYWGSIRDFAQTSSGRYQGTLTLRIEA